MSPTHTYKMRAESPFDFCRAWQAVEMATWQVSGGDPIGLGDCEITFTSSWPLARIIDALGDVVDGHVMRETVQPIAAYTGERGVPDCTRCGVERYVEHDPYGDGMCEACEDETSEDAS